LRPSPAERHRFVGTAVFVSPVGARRSACQRVNMSPEERARYRTLLIELRQHLDHAGPHKPEDADDLRDEDLAPLSEMLQSIASNRNKNRAGILKLVLAALGRIDNDPESYGLCIECDDTLPLGRLNLMPYAAYCVACQQVRERPKGTANRRSLTDFME
jgi:DnaK suppressor protein